MLVFHRSRIEFWYLKGVSPNLGTLSDKVLPPVTPVPGDPMDPYIWPAALDISAGRLLTRSPISSQGVTLKAEAVHVST